MLTVDREVDTFFPYYTCKYLRENKPAVNTTQQEEIQAAVDGKYQEVLSRFSAAMKTIDKDHAKSVYTSVDAVKYFDSLYARYF